LQSRRTLESDEHFGCTTPAYAVECVQTLNNDEDDIHVTKVNVVERVPALEHDELITGTIEFMF
jgi:hypothetical protein